MRVRGLLFCYALTAWFWCDSVVLALTVDDLDPEQEWRVEKILLRGIRPSLSGNCWQSY